ncbi:hypothetical protein BKK52_00835 [Rodentibacter trehalosifermentans]|uniref:Bacteriophage lambda Replication protein O N-terminal domain-containing protein n=2 Tax=Rodentibacter trehalosifermentans TaxID=1908263 RepID=A0A1V3J6N6_9PAST|nr:hypothetical protein BKK52_00835 [Rodentibacter trehalosifermentans]
MSNVVRIEELRLQQVEKEKTERQGAKKVSVDDGFTAIPNELLKAILRSKVLGWKGSYLLATILKTLSWHKESDWFTHSQVCEMMNIEPTKYHINQLSAARKELIKERVLFESGKKTGVNLDVFKWEMINPEKVGSSRNNRDLVPEKVGSSRNNRDLVPEKVGNGYPEKVGNTKETITKEKINTPHTPQGENGESAGKNIFDVAQSSLSEKNSYVEQAENALAYYNEISKSHCQDNSPFLKILEPQKSRKGWTLDEIKLVIRWVFATWRTHSTPKPQNICRVTRFDGYLSDAVNWVETQGDLNFEDVIEAFNRIFKHRYEPVELNIITKRNILNLLPHLKNKSIDGFENYFNFYNETVSEYYDKFGFSFVMKPETLQKVREGAL